MQRPTDQPASGSAPPRLPLRLAIGVTGHRSDVLPVETAERIEARLGEALDALAFGVARIAAQEAEFFDPAPPLLTFVSPLADGADQIAAEIALTKGFRLQAVLPFARDEYLADFADPTAAVRYRDLLSHAHRVLELPGDRAHALQAYVMAGRATVSHCDILIAVWDGLPPRGRGGTGEVVDLALVRGTPIIHVPISADDPVCMLWSGFDPRVVTTRNGPETAHEFSDEALGRVLSLLLAPPASPFERACLRSFYAERERNLRPHIEYPLLLALTGVRRFGKSSWRAEPYVDGTRSEWEPFRASCASGHGVTAEIDSVETAYCWSDRLAQHFAQTYRSGHVFNFIFGAFAVLIALTGLLVPSAKLVLAVAEFVVILAVIANTRIGTTAAWHRRWLDYRQLAERLRPMRSLKLLGIAAPDVAASGARAGPERWTEWYAAGVWRAMGCPSGTLLAIRQAALTSALAAHELRPQIDYHRAGAHQVETLDHRLHLIGTGLFAATIASCVVLIVGYLTYPEWTSSHSGLFVFLSAGLPAAGTAIFGIRVQGDFAGTAQRSRATADKLEDIAALLERGDIPLTRAADLIEQAARAMLADLGEWQLAHQQHELTVG